MGARHAPQARSLCAYDFDILGAFLNSILERVNLTNASSVAKPLTPVTWLHWIESQCECKADLLQGLTESAWTVHG